MLHIYRAWEPHVNQDSHTECWMLINCAEKPHVNQDLFISHTVSQRESSKFHLKIPACESQHCLQSNLSQTHSYHGVKRPNKKRNSNLWEVSFSSATVVSKLLLGCWGHFLYILCHYNPTAHSLMCIIHMQTQRTAWNMAFHMKQIVGGSKSYLCGWRMVFRSLFWKMKVTVSIHINWGNYCVERFY